MHTIIGSGGAIGTPLAKELNAFTQNIRLVSRNPKKVNETDQLFPADVLNATELDKAIEGSHVVYITVGFFYNTKLWRNTWPAFIENAIKSCIKHNAKMVFFDNIYMYDGSNLSNITEETPLNPSSEKGKIRKEVFDKIWSAVQSGKLTALIARSADFYGPSIRQTSMLTETVFIPLSKGKAANWMGATNFKHSFTYTLDAAKATAILGNTESAYNQIWHLPTSTNPPTGKEWIDAVATYMSVKPKTQVVTPFLLKILGWFIPVMREMPEMMYQYNQDYIFNSAKFESHFSFKPTPYLEGIKHIIETDYYKT